MELSGQLHISGRFIPWKEPRYSLNRGLAGPQSRNGLYGKEEIFLSRPGFEPSWHSHCNYYALWAAILKYFLQFSIILLQRVYCWPKRPYYQKDNRYTNLVFTLILIHMNKDSKWKLGNRKLKIICFIKYSIVRCSNPNLLQFIKFTCHSLTEIH